MEFEFDKFVDDIEKRKVENNNRRKVERPDIDMDEARRLRARRYHERWQNCIKWERR